MTFADIPAGASIFIDANTLVYHFGAEPMFGPASRDLLVRIKRCEIAGYTSTHIVAEMAHRLMAIEAMKSFGWPAGQIARRLQKSASDVQRLTLFRRAIQEVSTFDVQILIVRPDFLDAAAAVSQQTGLLTNDAMVVVVMSAHNLVNLASNDADFDRESGITRYSPV